MKKQSIKSKFPYGMCECDGAMCCRGYGPAAFSVVRDGKAMKVCTKCDLSSDTNKVLLVKKTDKTKIWMDYDPLGAMCIMFKLQESLAS